MQIKLETVKHKLAEHFTASRVRSVGNVIRLNTPSLEDKDMTLLRIIQLCSDADIKVKRSGTGLAVIVTLWT